MLVIDIPRPPALGTCAAGVDDCNGGQQKSALVQRPGWICHSGSACASIRASISAGPSATPQTTKDTHRQKRHQLDHGFQRDGGGQHRWCCSLASRLRVPKTMVKKRKPHRHPERDQGAVARHWCAVYIGDEHREGLRNGLQLQRDIGRAGRNAQQGHDHAQQVGFTVARRR